MKILCAFVCLSIGIFCNAQSSPEFVTGEIIVKINPQFGDKCSKSTIEITEVESLITKGAITTIEKLFPQHESLNTEKSKSKLIDLSTIYTFKIDPLSDPKKLIAQLNKMESVAYAEEKVINEVTYTPNDTLLGSQWYIGAVDLFRAWDVQQGDTNVVIAFTDTGTDTDHPDMVANYSYNYNDPINGIDDDADGYIDNFLGWDVADDDNDAGFGNSGHGINVGGLVSAVTDNVTGLSGAGFKTRLMPVKIDESSSGFLTAAYEGIVYAADQGAFIITNSWGSTVFSQFAQDVVNYAALNKGCLVIAATGNNKFENRFYPAAYNNVLSVGSLTSANLVKSDSRGSNYGYWVDIMAPGDNMLTTNAIGGYGVNGGTSMAAPVVAGIAGLVKAQFPHYTWQQVTEQIINNGNNIDSFNDPIYAGKIGAGRVNAFLAVSDSSKPGILFENNTISDGNDETFVSGDTLRVSGSFMNWLKLAKNVTVSIRTIDNKLQAIGSTTINIGDLNALDSFPVRSNPFQFIINQNIGYGEEIEFEISITADNYSKKQYFATTVNTDFLTVRENNLTVTIVSDGGLGYTSPTQQTGEGFKFKNGNSLLWEGSLLLGSQNNFVANKFRGETGSDNDFEINEAIRPVENNFSDFQSFSSSDFDSGSNDKLEIENKCFVFKQTNAQNSIIYQYRITNTGLKDYSNLFAGLVLDWDIFNYNNNKVQYDSSRQMGISYATDSNLFCGVRVILRDSALLTTHYAIDNTDDGSGGVSISGNEGFSEAEKLIVLSSNRPKAGANSITGNDILDVNSVGPVTLLTDSQFYVSFIITVAESIEALQTESDTLASLYRIIQENDIADEIPRFSSYFKVYPNPIFNSTVLEFRVLKNSELDITIFDINGKRIYRSANTSFAKGKHNFAINNLDAESGLYFIEVKGDDVLFRQKIVIAK